MKYFNTRRAQRQHGMEIFFMKHTKDCSFLHFVQEGLQFRCHDITKPEFYQKDPTAGEAAALRVLHIQKISYIFICVLSEKSLFLNLYYDLMFSSQRNIKTKRIPGIEVKKKPPENSSGLFQM